MNLQKLPIYNTFLLKINESFFESFGSFNEGNDSKKDLFIWTSNQ